MTQDKPKGLLPPKIPILPKREFVLRDSEKHNDHVVSDHPLLQRIYANRGIRQPEELDYSLKGLPLWSMFKDIELAVERLLQALDQNEFILILGDYDADGATAAALAILGLRSMGALNVDYLMSNRFVYGYGLSLEFAQAAIEKSPSLVVTVDNGITSVKGVQILKNAGVDVIVTDHHLPGAELPDATAIINPNQPGCSFPSGKIAGVAVMFYLLTALRARMQQRGDFDSEALPKPNMAQFLDLVALGTIADVVPLDRINRTLVAQGIARIQRGHCRPGIRALVELAGKNPDKTCSFDLGFLVAPRLNAAGRLDDISVGVECLLMEDKSKARALAESLHKMNAERRVKEQGMQQQAEEIASNIKLEDVAARGICLYGEDWNSGFTGLIASRIKDRYFEPVIAFAPVPGSEGMLAGSARSLPGLNIRDLLADLAAANPALLEKYGGHAMAAGLTVHMDNLDVFRREFHAALKRHFDHSKKSNTVLTDGPLEAEFFTPEIATMLRNAAPWGQQFSAPIFDNEFAVQSKKVVGKQHLKLTLWTHGRKIDAILFRAFDPKNIPRDEEQTSDKERIRAAFQLDVNHYNGESQLQLIIEYLEPVPPRTISVKENTAQVD